MRPFTKRMLPMRFDTTPGAVMARTRRRGVAMLLVVLAMGVAGATTAFYLSSRGNSASIGDNAESAAQAEWAAQCGADIAISALAQEIDWTTIGADGTLAENIDIAGAKVSLIVTSMSGGPPAPGERDMLLTAIASRDGMTSTAQRIVRISPPSDVADALDPTLKEFGIYAVRTLNLQPGATVGVWRASPLAKSGRTVKIGLGFTSSAGFSLSGTANLQRTQLYVSAAAAAGLKAQVNSGRLVGGDLLPVLPVAVGSTRPAGFASLSDLSGSLSTLTGGATTASPLGGAYNDVDIENGAVCTLDAANGPLFMFNRLRIRDTGVVAIKGDVSILVRGNLELNNLATIEMADAASRLTVYLMGELLVTNSTIGFDRSVARNAGRDLRDDFAYESASRIRIWRVIPSAGGMDDPLYQLQNRSLVRASIHAPDVQVDLATYSAIFGRLTGAYIFVSGGTAIFYDPALDNDCGFTDRSGPLYKPDGTPIDGLVDALAGFDLTKGFQALVADVTSLLGGVLELVGGLLGGGEETEPATLSNPVPMRMKQKHWPTEAASMEKGFSGGGCRRMNGTFIEPDSGITTKVEQLVDATIDN